MTWILIFIHSIIYCVALLTCARHYSSSRNTLGAKAESYIRDTHEQFMINLKYLELNENLQPQISFANGDI